MIEYVDDQGMLCRLPVSRYPDGTPMIKDLASPSAILVRFRPGNMIEDLHTALMFCDAVRARGGWVHTLVLPFVPGARQDRLNRRGDQLFTLQSVGFAINQCGFASVVICDPHSDVTPAMIGNSKVVTAADIFDAHPVLYDGVIAPDGGALHRCQEISRLSPLQLFQAWKRRDVSTGEITGFGCEPLKGRGRYVIVDDICDGGGTFIGLSKEIKARSQNIQLDLYVTHGLFPGGQEKVDVLRQHFSNIITTDTLIDTSQFTGIKLIRVVERLLRGQEITPTAGTSIELLNPPT